MADLKLALEDVRDDAESRRLAQPVVPARAGRRTLLLVAGLVASATGVLALGAWWLNARSARLASPPASLTRLTSDVGWTDHPAVSLDGRLLAYSSDRGGDGNLDIWLQQIPDGTPVRLTRDPADDFGPSFSADSTRIAFQSSRHGGGIYLIPTLGGEERLLAPRGFSPRFSPDGNWLAYGVAERGGSRIYVAPAGGGPATAVAPDFYRAQAHVWSPDGRHLLFWGQRRRDGPPENNVDWYVTAVPDDSPVPTQARSVIGGTFQAFRGLPFPDAWVNVGDRVIFHGNVGDSSNMWQVPIERGSWRVSGTLQRVTFGTTDEAAASVTSDGRMVFISRTTRSDIWSLPVDADRATVNGTLQRVTEDAADDYDPTLSDDGSVLVFRSRRAGRFAVVLKRVGSSAETVLTRLSADHHPAISRDGTKVAYSFAQGGKMPTFVVAVSGAPPELVCDDCGEVKEWFPSGDRLLYVTGRDPSSVGLLNIGSGHDDAWLKHPVFGIYGPRVSSDGGWVVFNSRTDRLTPARVVIARIRGAVVADEKDWVEVSNDGEAPNWSPRGTLVYFWSDRDGSPCLWVQRLDPTTKRPIGSPFSLQHFHERGLSWKNLQLGEPGIAVTRNRVVFNLGEHTGNIWMTELLPTRE